MIDREHTYLLETYLKEKKALGGSVQAIRDARSRVPHYLSFLEEQGVHASQADIRTARSYMEYIILRGTKDGRPYRMTTVASYRQAASSFSRWLCLTGKSLADPFQAVKSVRVEKTVPRDLPGQKKLASLFDRLSRFNQLTGLKARKRRYLTHIMAELIYSTGLRISETAALKEGDLDLERKEILVREGKGGFSRKVFLNDYAATLLRKYLSVRLSLLTEKSNKSLLFGAGSDELGKAFNRDLKAACAEEELVPLTAHGLRHTLGYHLLKEGCPLRQIQDVLGHRRIRNTEIYTKVDVKEVKEQLDRFHPRVWE